VNNFAMNEERKQKHLFSEPMFVNRYIVAARVDSADFGGDVESIADIAGKSTLNSVGTNMATAIENYNKASPQAPVKQQYGETGLLLVLQQVEAGQWDFNLIDKPMFDFYAREFGLKLNQAP